MATKTLPRVKKRTKTNTRRKNRAERWPDAWFMVDTGQCVIGDPCHTGADDGISKDIDAGRAINGRLSDVEQLRDERGLERGVRVPTGIGDGLYPVYVDYVDDPFWGRRVSAVHIVFIPIRPGRMRLNPAPRIDEALLALAQAEVGALYESWVVRLRASRSQFPSGAIRVCAPSAAVEGAEDRLVNANRSTSVDRSAIATDGAPDWLGE